MVATSANGATGTTRVESSLFAALATSSVAALLVQLPCGRIVETSPGARLLLGPDSELKGHELKEFALREPTHVLELIYQGHLSGYERTNELRVGGRAIPIHGWVHKFSTADPPTLAIAVLDPVHVDTTGRPVLADLDVAPVVGAADNELRIESVSSDVQALLGYAPTELVGRSLLGIVAPSGIGHFMSAIADATNNERGAIIRIPIMRSDGMIVWSCMLIAPLVPAPSLAFAILDDCPRGDDAATMDRLIKHLVRGVRAGGVAGRAARHGIATTPLSELSSRELEVAYRLADGNRVPAIAAAMFITQSTVRNYLSSIFQKLQLKSQQGLIDYMRQHESG